MRFSRAHSDLRARGCLFLAMLCSFFAARSGTLLWQLPCHRLSIALPHPPPWVGTTPCELLIGSVPSYMKSDACASGPHISLREGL